MRLFEFRLQCLEFLANEVDMDFIESQPELKEKYALIERAVRTGTLEEPADKKRQNAARNSVDEGLPLAETAEEAAWMSAGNCRNYPPEVFFPHDGVGVDRARKICVGCGVIDACLEYALNYRIEHGVWGGASERERRRILKRRKNRN